MKIKILIASFGFTKGEEYTATRHTGGFFANNGTLGKFISEDEAEEVAA